MKMESDKTITCEFDLESGKLKITAPPEHFPAAAKAMEGIAALRSCLAKRNLAGEPASAPVPPNTARAPGPPETSVGKERNPRSNRPAGGSTARTGRIGSFEPVKFGLTEAQERELRDFYQSKAPQGQPEKVACAMYKAEQLLGKREMSYNEIYSVMRLGGEKELPKALDVLLARLIEENWVSREADGFALKYLARDHVEQKLPRTSGPATKT